MTQEEILEKFHQMYTPYRTFPAAQPDLWDLCCRAAMDPEVMAGIQWANDWLKVPPVKSFLAYSRSALEKKYGTEIELEQHAKRGLGAFWGAIFKGILGYTGQQNVSVSLPWINTRTATYYWKESLPAGGDS